MDIGRDHYKIEILEYLPVLPNLGIVAREQVPGHNHIDFGNFVVAGNDGYRKEFITPTFDREMLTFLSILKAAGYEVNAPRDIALLADGTPIFVDPGTIYGKSTLHPDRSFNLFSRYFHERVEKGLFNWPKKQPENAPAPDQNTGFTSWDYNP